MLECLLGTPQNGIYKPAHAIGRGTLLVGQISIATDRSIDPTLARRAAVSSEEEARYGVSFGDILVSRVFATLEGVGQPALVPRLEEPAVFESNMMRLRTSSEVIDAEILFHWLLTARIRRQLVARVNLSNQASVNQQAINPLPIGVPRSPEQARILDVIHAHRDAIHAANAELSKLQHLKSGLLSDLLTGRVRVPEGISCVE